MPLKHLYIQSNKNYLFKPTFHKHSKIIYYNGHLQGRIKERDTLSFDNE